MKESGDAWTKFRKIDKERLSLVLENTHIKAANLSYRMAADSDLEDPDESFTNQTTTMIPEKELP